jgi:hypothetical protein
MPYFADKAVTNYTPSIAPTNPEDMRWWIEEELHRIALAINFQNTLIAIEGDGIIEASPIPNSVILGIGDDPVIEVPAGGAWNTITGEWTVSETGIYTISADVNVDGFGSGNRDYEVDLNVLVDGLLKTSNGTTGRDEYQTLVMIAQPILLIEGERVQIEFLIVHDQFTGNAPYTYEFSYLKVNI